jgi:glycosyltransferase involved in cell wall biosynthesis
MLGWEFPPFISGGLGAACYGLTKAMSRRGDRVLFVLPEPSRPGFSAAYGLSGSSGVHEGALGTSDFENVQFFGLPVHGGDVYARSQPRMHASAARPAPAAHPAPAALVPPHDILAEAHKFTERARELALRQREQGRHFDVVHAHEWPTFEAGAAVAKALHVPLVAHVHSTEYDRRAGEPPDEQIVARERAGLASADAVIAVSRYTAQKIARHYGLNGGRVTVVHNALEIDSRLAPQRPAQIGAQERIVLFVGRMTSQKGPDIFVRAAARVLAEQPMVRFVMAGTGEQFNHVRELAQQLGIEPYFLFTGFLRGEDIDALYRAADVLVMPSLSEPFGLVSLEAMAREVPVIISRQSGAAEVLQSVLKVDFWDVEDIAAKILNVLRDPELAEALASRGSFEVRQMRWSDAADSVAQVYDRLLHDGVAA